MSSCSSGDYNVDDKASNREAQAAELYGVVIYRRETKVRREYVTQQKNNRTHNDEQNT